MEYRRDPEGWRDTHGCARTSLVETAFRTMRLRFTRCQSLRGSAQQQRGLLVKVLTYNIGRLYYFECAGRPLFAQGREKQHV